MLLVLWDVINVTPLFRATCLIVSTMWSMLANRFKLMKDREEIRFDMIIRHIPTIPHKAIGGKVDEVIRLIFPNEIIHAVCIGYVCRDILYPAGGANLIEVGPVWVADPALNANNIQIGVPEQVFDHV